MSQDNPRQIARNKRRRSIAILVRRVKRIRNKKTEKKDIHPNSTKRKINPKRSIGQRAKIRSVSKGGTRKGKIDLEKDKSSLKRRRRRKRIRKDRETAKNIDKEMYKNRDKNKDKKIEKEKNKDKREETVKIVIEKEKDKETGQQIDAKVNQDKEM